MNTNRRDFLKKSGYAGLGLTGFGMIGCKNQTETNNPFPSAHRQQFNMHGYAAPPVETVRLGLIGLGNRGSGALRRLRRIEGVEIIALCDLIPEQVNQAIDSLEGSAHHPDGYSGGPDEWKKMCEREDLDLIYICTPWHLHTPQAVYAMEHDKHAATEVPAAQTIEECWQLVETSERTRKHCMMLENTCYDFFEMVTLKMAREGFFGDIVHGEGAYLHSFTFNPNRKNRTWRIKENIDRNGNLYPMHGLGPIAQVMDLNCGDQMDYMVSVSSNDFMMGNLLSEAAANDEFWKPFADIAKNNHRGNMNTSVIRTQRGRSIMLQHDITSPRPYSRIHLVSGTRGIARKWPLPARIATSHDGWVSDEELALLEEEFMPEITRRVGELAREVGGHGGMDTLMDWRLIDCLRNGLPLDMDVYDAALWSSVIPLSEWSVANRSNSVEVPDFTSGAWRTNKPGMDIEIQQGGTTRII